MPYESPVELKGLAGLTGLTRLDKGSWLVGIEDCLFLFVFFFLLGLFLVFCLDGFACLYV